MASQASQAARYGNLMDLSLMKKEGCHGVSSDVIARAESFTKQLQNQASLHLDEFSDNKIIALRFTAFDHGEYPYHFEISFWADKGVCVEFSNYKEPVDKSKFEKFEDLKEKRIDVRIYSRADYFLYHIKWKVCPESHGGLRLTGSSCSLTELSYYFSILFHPDGKIHLSQSASPPLNLPKDVEEHNPFHLTQYWIDEFAEHKIILKEVDEKGQLQLGCYYDDKLISICTEDDPSAVEEVVSTGIPKETVLLVSKFFNGSERACL